MALFHLPLGLQKNHDKKKQTYKSSRFNHYGPFNSSGTRAEDDVDDSDEVKTEMLYEECIQAEEQDMFPRFVFEQPSLLMEDRKPFDRLPDFVISTPSRHSNHVLDLGILDSPSDLEKSAPQQAEDHDQQHQDHDEEDLLGRRPAFVIEPLFSHRQQQPKIKREFMKSPVRLNFNFGTESKPFKIENDEDDLSTTTDDLGMMPLDFSDAPTVKKEPESSVKRSHSPEPSFTGIPHFSLPPPTSTKSPRSVRTNQESLDEKFDIGRVSPSLSSRKRSRRGPLCDRLQKLLRREEDEFKHTRGSVNEFTRSFEIKSVKLEGCFVYAECFEVNLDAVQAPVWLCLVNGRGDELRPGTCVAVKRPYYDVQVKIAGLTTTMLVCVYFHSISPSSATNITSIYSPTSRPRFLPLTPVWHRTGLHSHSIATFKQPIAVEAITRMPSTTPTPNRIFTIRGTVIAHIDLHINQRPAKFMVNGSSGSLAQQIMRTARGRSPRSSVYQSLLVLCDSQNVLAGVFFDCPASKVLGSVVLLDQLLFVQRRCIPSDWPALVDYASQDVFLFCKNQSLNHK